MFKKLIAASAFAAFAATGASASTDVLQLSGTVDYQCTLQMSAQTSGSVTISSGTSQHQLGTMAIACNDPEGFTFSITSDNNFQLTDGGSNAIDYNLRVDDGSLIAQTFNANGSISVGSFQSNYAEGTNAVLSFNPTTVTAVPGGVALTDKITFEITGD